MAVKIRERPKGSGEWWLFIDHQGKRKAKKIGKDKKLARDMAKKIEAKLALGEMNGKSIISDQVKHRKKGLNCLELDHGARAEIPVL